MTTTLPNPTNRQQATCCTPTAAVAPSPAESRDLAAYAERKRKSKKIPLIVGNLIQDGFGGDDNRLVLFDAHGETPLPPGSKLELARRLVAHIATLLEKP